MLMVQLDKNRLATPPGGRTNALPPNGVKKSALEDGKVLG